MYEAPAPSLIRTPKSKMALEAHREMAFNSLPYFEWRVMGNDMQTCMDPRLCLKHPSHFHGKWNYHVTHFNTVYEACSRGHIKTTWTQIVNAWDMLRYPDIVNRSFTNLEISYAKDQAIEWHTGLDGEGGLKGMLLHAIDNLQLSYDFSTKSKANLALQGISPLGNSNSSASVGRSMGGNIRMKHTDRITLDDILNESMTMSMAKAEKIFRGAILGTRTPRLDGSNSQLLYIGTVLEEDDILDKIRKGEIGKGIFKGGEHKGVINKEIPIWDDYADQFTNIKAEMVASGEYYELEELLLQEGNRNITTSMITLIMDRITTTQPRVLWRRKRPLSYHLEQYDTLGKLFYDQEFLLKTISEEAALFKTTHISRAKERGAEFILGREPAEGSIVTIGADFSIGVTKNSDYIVFFVNEYTREGLEIPLDMIRFRGHDLRTDGKLGEVEDEIERQFIKVIDDWRGSLTYTVAEEVGFQRTFGNTLRASGRQVEAYNTGSDKHQKVIGIPGLDKPFRDNAFIIPWGDEYSRKQMAIFIHELRGWQWNIEKKQYISKARHDDTTMAWWMSRIAKDHYKRGIVGMSSNTALSEADRIKIDKQRARRMIRNRR